MKRVFFSLILLIYHSIHAIITEVQNFKEVIPHLTEDSLLTLDIDDRLLVPKQMLGSDVWFENRVKQHKALGTPSVTAFEKALNEWEGIRHFTEMQLVEPGIEKIIHDLQKKSRIIMGLSTQPMTLSRITPKQLKDHQINLALTAPSTKSYYFQNENKGVLFASGTSKGKALFHLLEVLEKKYNRIIFINDKASHLSDVEQEAKRNNVEFIGLRYGFSDFRRKSFDPKIATIQLQVSGFTHILSDTEAATYLQQEKCLH